MLLRTTLVSYKLVCLIVFLRNLNRFLMYCLQATLKDATILLAVIDLDRQFSICLSIYYALRNSNVPPDEMPLAVNFWRFVNIESNLKIILICYIRKLPIFACRNLPEKNLWNIFHMMVHGCMFRCPLASFVWCWIRDSLGWDGIPTSLNEFTDQRLGRLGNDPKLEHNLKIFLFAGVAYQKRLGFLWHLDC